jgi:ABC-type amino acid transport substrate-binding protein
VDAGIIIATSAPDILKANPEIGLLGEPILPVPTPERQKQVAFSTPYAEVSSVVLALRKNLPAGMAGPMGEGAGTDQGGGRAAPDPVSSTNSRPASMPISSSNNAGS